MKNTQKRHVDVTNVISEGGTCSRINGMRTAEMMTTMDTERRWWFFFVDDAVIMWLVTMYHCFFCHSHLYYSRLPYVTERSQALLIEIEAIKYTQQRAAPSSKQQAVSQVSNAHWFGVDGQPAVFEKGGYDTFRLSSPDFFGDPTPSLLFNYSSKQHHSSFNVVRRRLIYLSYYSYS